MDSDTQSWLIGVPFDTQGSHEPRETPVFSRRQKRELAGMTGLVMASIAFFLTPLLLSSTTARPELTHALAVSESAVIPPPNVDAPVRPASTIKRARHTGRTHPTAVAGGTSGTTAAYAEPTGTTGADPEPTRTAAANPRRKGGLFRALVGDGRYRVQPFPTPATN